LRNPSKLFFGIDLTSSSFRELTNVMVIFSTIFLIYMAIADWGGLTILQRLVGKELEAPSFLYFCGVALVIFSVRRIADQ
jgi:uncharacterized membrane protein YidH (DUF202 family)